MGFFSAMRSGGVTPGERVEAAMADVVDLSTRQPSVTAALPTGTELASPFAPTPNHLNSVVWADVIGTENLPLTRAAAMQVPAVARFRHLIAGKIAEMPLQVFRGAELVPEQPTWTYRTDHGLPPYHRMLWTVDDLLFHGWSLWVARRGAGDALVEAARIAIDRWKFTAAGVIEVDNKPVNARDVILFPGPHEGILNFAGRSIRIAGDLEASAAKFAKTPSAWLELHQTGGEPLTREARRELVSEWAAARRGENGGVGFTNESIEVKEHGAAAEHLLIEGRNASAVDIARVVSAPAAMADATNAGASLTYETTTGRNAEFIDYGLSLYMTPITARLSMDDVVPRGQRVAFDTSELRTPAPTPTGPATED